MKYFKFPEFNGSFIVKQIFVQPKFATAPLSFAYIMLIEKNLKLVFVKLESICHTK